VVFGDGPEPTAGQLGRFSVIGGLSTTPDATDDRIDPDFRVRYFILGGEMQLRKNGYAYAEWRIDDSTGAQKFEAPRSTIGLRYGSMWGLHSLY
jgi:hypothetical protein